MPPSNVITRPRVYARLRPLEGRDAGQEELFTVNENALEYQRDGQTSKYGFDRVFGASAKQEDLFESIGASALQSLRQGFNSTIMAYGQTGSGKTYSMEGMKDGSGQWASKGLIPRLFDELFASFGGDSSLLNFAVNLQFMELYNENLQDLFNARKVLQVQLDPQSDSGFCCPEAVRHSVTSSAEALEKFEQGCTQRATGATGMNENSSRSHALLIITVTWTEEKGSCHAVINLVDLAGSEGLKKTGASGKKMREGIKINLSLTKLALVVRCLSEGSQHIPYRESKLTMMLQRGLGGDNMLHIILALSSSAEQVSESTACLRFGQSCLSMTVHPSANAVEKEQVEMKAVIQEQMQEINDLNAEMEELKKKLEAQESQGEKDIPDFLIAQHIALNKDALRDELKEADAQIDEIRAALEAKRSEAQKLKEGGGDDALDQVGGGKVRAGANSQQSTEEMEAAARQVQMERLKEKAALEQERKAFERELAQMLEIQNKLVAKLEQKENEAPNAEAVAAAEAAQGAKIALLEQKAAELEAEVHQREAKTAAMTAEHEQREKQLQELLKEREAKSSMGVSTAELDQNISQTQEATNALSELDKEEQASLAVQKAQEAELMAMRDELAALRARRDAAGTAMEGSNAKQRFDSLGTYKSVPEMIEIAATKLNMKALAGRVDPSAVGRVLQTLPVLVACNDLRALCELEAGNRTLFQNMGGVSKMVDCLYPNGPQAPYATHIARTLPAIMDAEGRKLFLKHASTTDAEGTVKLKYLSALLASADPDDKEHACLCIAAVAQESPPTRQAFFEHGVAAEVLTAFNWSAEQKVPRQRLQRVAVMALSELAQDYPPLKDLLLERGGVSLLLGQCSEGSDPFVIKETLNCLGRLTQGHPKTQQELERLGATQTYSQLLFAQMYDPAIAELSALALVNLTSESSGCMAAIEADPRYKQVRFEMLASMCRALSSSLLRQGQATSSSTGSDSFKFWGAAAAGAWVQGNAGGDRTHTSFVDNPQFILKAPKGTNLCIVLFDALDDQRQHAKVASRPLFLRLCITAATPECLADRLKILDINSGKKAAPVDEMGVPNLTPGTSAFVDVARRAPESKTGGGA